MITYQRLDIPGFRAFVCNGVLGDQYVLDIDDGLVKETDPYIAITVDGKVELSSDAYPEPWYRVAGNTSLSYPYGHPKVGKLLHVVQSETYRYYCISDPGLRKLEAQEVRLVAGQSVRFPVGWILFVASGEVALAGTPLATPGYVDAVESDATVTAVSDVLAVCIKRFA